MSGPALRGRRDGGVQRSRPVRAGQRRLHGVLRVRSELLGRGLLAAVPRNDHSGRPAGRLRRQRRLRRRPVRLLRGLLRRGLHADLPGTGPRRRRRAGVQRPRRLRPADAHLHLLQQSVGSHRLRLRRSHLRRAQEVRESGLRLQREVGKPGNPRRSFSGEFCQFNCDFQRDCSGNGVCNQWAFDWNSMEGRAAATASSTSTGSTASSTAPTRRPAPTTASASRMVRSPREFDLGKCLCNRGFAGDHCQNSAPRVDSMLIVSAVLALLLALQFYLWRRQSVEPWKRSNL